MMAGFVTSRVAVSVSMFVLAGLAALHSRPATIWQNFRSRPALVALTLPFVAVFLSGLYSDNIEEWIAGLRIKLPFLVLPVVFAGLPKLGKKHIVILLYSYIFIFFICTSVVLANYVIHSEQVNQQFLRGGGIPVPFSHVRYSLMLSFSFFVAIYLLRNKLFLQYDREKYPLLFYAVFSFIAVHVLAVRSGILALYAGLLLGWVVYVVRGKKYLTGILLLGIIVAVPFVAYHFSPTMQNKWKYMVYNWKEFRSGNINYQYDGMRYMSIYNALAVWKKYPVFGCGAGDLTEEINRMYAKTYPALLPENRLMPHNQFAWTAASTGLVGLVMLLLAVTLSILSEKNYRNLLPAVFWLIILSSLFTEATFEEQMGTAFYLLFTLLFLTQKFPDA